MNHTDIHTDTQEDYCNPPPTLGLINNIRTHVQYTCTKNLYTNLNELTLQE